MNNNQPEVFSLKKLILDCDDLGKLYEYKLDLTQDVNEAYQNANTAQTREDRHTYFAKVNEYKAMLDVVEHKIRDTKDTGSRLNYNFRMAAKQVLQPATYKKIMELSHQTIRELKENKKELRSNRIE